MALTRDDISLEPGDRAFLVGASRSGKSTLGNQLLQWFREDEPDARLAIFDTKPRWRGTKLVDGTSSRKIYRAMARGDTVPGAISCSRLQDWGLAWDHDNNPTQTVIFQRVNGSHADNIRFQIACAEKLKATQDAKRPTLAYIDEGMDFFESNASAKGGSDIIQRMFRSGGEMNLGTLIGMQRPVGVNMQTLTETSKAYLFRLLYEEDVKKLWSIGWPKNTNPPSEAHIFRFWDVANPRVAPEAKLTLGRKAA